jgi:hypothetical protein
MTAEAPKKRKIRFARAILIALLLVCVLWTVMILGIFAVEDALPPIEPGVASIETTFICTRCGALSKIKTVTLFGFELNHSPESKFTTIAPSFLGTNVCNHYRADGPEMVGMRAKGFSFHPFDWGSREIAYPDTDFFSSAPALKEALSSLSKTNLIAAQALLSGVVTLRMEVTSAATNVLTALESNDVEQLKSQLLAKDLSKDGVATELRRLRDGGRK